MERLPELVWRRAWLEPRDVINTHLRPEVRKLLRR